VKFIIHFIVRTAIKNHHFDLVWSAPVSEKQLRSIRQACANHATQKMNRAVSDFFTPDDIVIANIIPIPSGDEPVQAGGA